MSRKRDQVDPQLAAMLRQRRDALGLKQHHVADALDLSGAQIAKYESGQTAITTQRLREFAALLDFDPAPFVRPADEPESAYPMAEDAPRSSLHDSADEPPEPDPNPDEDDLLGAYRSLRSPDLRRAVLEFVRKLAAEMPASGSQRPIRTAADRKRPLPERTKRARRQ